jgi:demethylsterigmatocystin 6-O-methyltransferase
MHVVGEAGVDDYVATNVTRHLTIPKLEAGTKHTYDLVCMAVMQLDPFLAKTGYKNPTDPKNCPFQDAFHTEDSLFEWFPKHPDYLNNFNLYMTGQRDGRANWLDFFPFEEQLVKGFKGGNDAVMLVDVGGARGHEVENIKTRYPHLPGRFILQDLPETAKQALDVKGMEVIEYDFFTPQPIKGEHLL